VIISRTPLRITLGGGGTDIPHYFTNYGPGFLVSAAIDKYIYISVHHNFDQLYSLKYTQIENEAEIKNLQHPIFREVLKMLEINEHIDITSLADIPSGTGLGSSGSFTVGLIKALTGYLGKSIGNHEIAELASKIEIEILNYPVGKQDQFIGSLGGLKAFEFKSNGLVIASDINVKKEIKNIFFGNLYLFYTGKKRKAAEQLKNISQSKSMDPFLRKNLDIARKMAYETVLNLESGQLEKIGLSLTEQWRIKISRDPSDYHLEIDNAIRAGIQAGALGGKLIGAGGGGCILFYCEKPKNLRAEMKKYNFPEITFDLDDQGSTIIL
jgi:D-glycero-alpha-D-manno-heptose-7-phosphate kinase